MRKMRKEKNKRRQDTWTLSWPPGYFPFKMDTEFHARFWFYARKLWLDAVNPGVKKKRKGRRCGKEKGAIPCKHVRK